jgi:A1 cistron-splicing factor AAR2
MKKKIDIKALDNHLGPYPLIPDDPLSPNTYQTWLSLTDFVTQSILSRILPLSSCISTVYSSSYFSDVPDERLPIQSFEKEYRLHFTQFDLKKSFPEQCQGSELTKYARDKSYLLLKILKKNPGVIGELQLSFLIFIVGQVYDGFEQWKQLILLFCFSLEALENKELESLFVQFIGKC